MSFTFKKHPKGMNLQELYQAFTGMQEDAKAQGQHLPLYMDNQPPTPDKAGLPNFHVPSVRGLVELAYNQQNNTLSPSAPQGQQVAQVTPKVTKGMSQGFKGSPEASINAIGIMALDQAEVRVQIRQLADTGMSKEDFIKQNNPNKAALKIFEERVKERSPVK